MPEAHRQFLSEFERGDHDWSTLDVTGVDGLPAVRWKLRNLATLSPKQRVAQSDTRARGMRSRTVPRRTGANPVVSGRPAIGIKPAR